MPTASGTHGAGGVISRPGTAYLALTAAFTSGLYAPLLLDRTTELSHVPEAISLWTVLFLVPYILVERATAIFRFLRPTSSRAA